MRSRRHRGTTLLEILIAVMFLAICASAIVEGVWTANGQAAYALRRSRIVSMLQDQIETIRGLASSGTLANYASTATPVTLGGGTSGQMLITTTVTLESNSLVLYDVTCTATWTEETAAGTRTDTAKITTVVKD